MNTENLELQETEQLVEDAMVETATEVDKTQEQQRLTPELIKTADMAIRVLIAATDTAFKQNVFKEMNDVACIDKSVKMCEEFIQNEVFKVRNYNKILVESMNEEGQPTITLMEPAFVETGVPGVTRATIPVQEGAVAFMFHNEGATLLSEGAMVYNVNGLLVPYVPAVTSTEEVA